MVRTMTKLKEVKKLVEQILAEDERARNDDKWLIYRVLSHYTKVYIPFEDFEKIPSYETITRARRLIQNKEGKYLPTDPEVLKKRRIFEEEIKEWVRSW